MHCGITAAAVAAAAAGLFPCILGHEAAGIVESVGQGVTSVKPGEGEKQQQLGRLLWNMSAVGGKQAVHCRRGSHLSQAR
jgi:hypothetical protein